MSNVEGEQHASKPDWKYCAIGNIAETHLDEEGSPFINKKTDAPGIGVRPSFCMCMFTLPKRALRRSCPWA